MMRNEEKRAPASKKARIYFARTYRHLHLNALESALYLLLFLVPAMVLVFFFYDELTAWFCHAAAWLLNMAGAPEAKVTASVFLPRLGPVYSLELPTVLPGYGSIPINLVVSLLLLWLVSTGRRKGRPLSIYLSIILHLHMMACVFFLLGRDYFPYTTADYADLYIKQEVGIWIMFLLLMGLIMGVLGTGNIIRRILTVGCVMIYSVAFGVVRYALFLTILTRASVLYMPIMFFALGPVFDFLYFVAFYAMSTNRMIRTFDSKQKGEWAWA